MKIIHEVGIRTYIFTISYDSVSIAAGNAEAAKTCISGWETIPSISNAKSPISDAMIELWSWATCERPEYLLPALAIIS